MKQGLTYYLEHPERVSELSEAEINDWVAKYPYAQSVKWLKARYDLDLGLPTMRESVLAAAAASDDLVFLRYQLLHDSSKVAALKSEVKDGRSQVEKEKENVVASDPEKTPAHKDESLASSDKLDAQEPKGSEVKSVVESQMIAQEKSESNADRPIDVEASINIDEAVEDSREIKIEASDTIGADAGSMESSSPQSSPEKQADDMRVRPTAAMKARQVDDLLNEYSNEISGFSKWLLAQEKSEGTISHKAGGVKKKSSKKKKKRKKKSKLEKLIDHSIVEREGVISETYANLLATQGYTQKAIELYQRLMLKFPEKSGYFAAKIEELQK